MFDHFDISLFVGSDTDLEQKSFSHSFQSHSLQRYFVGLQSELCGYQSGSSTPNFLLHVSMDFTSCAGIKAKMGSIDKLFLQGLVHRIVQNVFVRWIFMISWGPFIGTSGERLRPCFLDICFIHLLYLSPLKPGVIYTTDILDRETKDSYWLTVYASDRGVVPQFTTIDVFVQVEDINDNAPLTSEPLYRPSVPENSPPDVSVIQIQAQDPDTSPSTSVHWLSYQIVSGNPQHFFNMDPHSGKNQRTTHLIHHGLRLGTNE